MTLPADEAAYMENASPEPAPETEVARWAATKHLDEVEAALSAITPLPWTMHRDPARTETFYISGPPDTEVVMEGLTYDNARNILFLMRSLPETGEFFRDLASLWDVLADAELRGGTEESTYFDIVSGYQLKIAQLEGSPAPVPAVEKAGDLSFMHIGHLLVLDTVNSGPADPSGASPDGDNKVYTKILAVKPSQLITDGVRVVTSYEGSIHLPADTPVTVLINQPRDWEIEESPETAPPPEAEEVTPPTE